MNPLLEIKSIRIRKEHINPLDVADTKQFASINRAKAHSRELGGAGKVRAFPSLEAAKPLIKEIAKARAEAALKEEKENV